MAVSLTHIENVLDLLDIYDAIYPTNYEKEKERFFDAVDSGGTYNPQYQYDTPAIDETETLLTNIEKSVESPLDKRLVAGLRSTKRMIEAVGSQDITAASMAAYGSPNEKTVQQAKEMYHKPVDRKDQPAISAQIIKDAFATMFDALDMEYDCRLIPEETNRNDPLEKQILIGKDITFRPMRAKRMVIHESTHAVRTYNGMQHDEPALIYGTNGYETAEEGLPTFNESEVGVFEDTVPKITSRVIAIAEKDLSFQEMYELMREYGLSKRLAFIRTFRIKRGLTDTAQPGGFIKDHIYFEGYSRIREHPYLADDLYIGKVSFEDMVDLDLTYTPMITREQHIRAYNDAIEVLESDQ